MKRIYEVSYDDGAQTKKLYFVELSDRSLLEIAKDILSTDSVEVVSKFENQGDYKTIIRKFASIGSQDEITIYVTELDVKESYENS